MTCVTVAALLALAAFAAITQPCPTKRLRLCLYVGFMPGDSVDQTARLAAARLSEQPTAAKARSQRC